MAPVVASPWPRVPWWHHTPGGISMVMCPSVSPHSWWHLHGCQSPAVPPLVVAPPWPYVPSSHHTHVGTSMDMCALVSPHPWWHIHGHLSPHLAPLVAWPGHMSPVTAMPFTGDSSTGAPTLCSVPSDGWGKPQPPLSCPINIPPLQAASKKGYGIVRVTL